MEQKMFAESQGPGEAKGKEGREGGNGARLKRAQARDPVWMDG
jgi:hypothetical protein